MLLCEWLKSVQDLTSDPALTTDIVEGRVKGLSGTDSRFRDLCFYVRNQHPVWSMRGTSKHSPIGGRSKVVIWFLGVAFSFFFTWLFETYLDLSWAKQVTTEQHGVNAKHAGALFWSTVEGLCFVTLPTWAGCNYIIRLVGPCRVWFFCAMAFGKQNGQGLRLQAVH